mgnify:CR=1 FL=1
MSGGVIIGFKKRIIHPLFSVNYVTQILWLALAIAEVYELCISKVGSVCNCPARHRSDTSPNRPSCLHSLGSVECADTWRVRCQSPKSAMTLRHYKCDVTSLLDRATCFGVVMGGERERGATEGTPCQI